MATQAIKEKSWYRAHFESDIRERSNRTPSWLIRLRENAFERFEASGFPTTDQEDWKYTNVALVARGEFKPAGRGTDPTSIAIDFEQYVLPESTESRMVFIDGVFRSELSNLTALPTGVVAVDLGEAVSGEFADRIQDALTSHRGEHTPDGFVELNTAFLAAGAFLLFPRDVVVDAPIQLLWVTSTAADEAIFPRVVVISERGSSATIVESHIATDDVSYFADTVTEISVGDGARLTHYKVQRESDVAFHVASTVADLGRDSSYDLTTVTLGAKLSRHNIEVRMDHAGAECWVDGLYLVGTGQHTDTHSLIDHRQPHCTSHQNYKGILDGKSRAVFNGRVFVHRDAQKTDAVQSNKNLLLSPEARVDTKPQLEIYADDVKCAHGATVGQLEEEELFYLVSRGLHTELARNLLTYGFAEEIVEKIKIESIRAQLDEAILNRLHARLEA
jgi:Fe-S cluster assembly protein SufD